jgi:endonuclease/exonuclease/phosphatase family metal-dependent hydrolase
MKLLTWNTKYGRGTPAALALARSLDVDGVLLQEASPDRDWSGPMIGATVAEREWGSWVLLRAGRVEPVDIDGYAGWVAGGRVTGPEGADTGEAYVFSVHSPTGEPGSPRASYVEESLRIVTAVCAKVPPRVPLIIGGDFNFKSLGVRAASAVLRNTRQERQALRQFQELGLSLAWQDCHPGQPLPQTLRWTRNPATAFHCDGFLFRDCGAMTVRCDVLRSPEIAAASDHNPVVLELDPVPVLR